MAKICLSPVRYNRPRNRSLTFYGRLTLLVMTIGVLLISPGRIEAGPPFPERLTSDAAKEQLDPVTLQLKWQHQFQFAGYYAAVEKGFYREAGLDVTIQEATETEEASRKVLAGEAEFGVAMSDLVLLRSKGYPLVALAAIYQHSPLVILAPKDTGIDTIHNLVGKRVMLEAHSDELLAYLESEGVSASQMIIHPYTAGVSQLIEGKIDAMSAYSTDEPFLLKEKNIAYNLFSPRAGGIDFYGDTLFTTEEQVREHPERVDAFLEASIKGWEYALNNQEEIIDLILSKYSQRHSRDHLRYEADVARRLILADVVEIGYMNPGRWRHMAAVYASINMVPYNTSLEGFIYDRNPRPDLTSLYVGLGGAVLTAILAFFVATRFYKLNRALNQQILKRAEVETKLRESERKMSTLLSNLPGIAYRCQVDKNWTMEFVSEGSVELTGYTPTALINNRTIAYGQLIHPQDRERVQHQVQDALNELRPFKLVYRIITESKELKWVWEQGRGIYSSNGELRFLEGFVADISEQKKTEVERESLIKKLQDAAKEIKVLRGILPICASCKKIRDDRGYWNQIEAYISHHSEAEFSHGICPDCAQELYPDFYQ